MKLDFEIKAVLLSQLGNQESQLTLTWESSKMSSEIALEFVPAQNHLDLRLNASARQKKNHMTTLLCSTNLKSDDQSNQLNMNLFNLKLTFPWTYLSSPWLSSLNFT